MRARLLVNVLAVCVIAGVVLFIIGEVAGLSDLHSFELGALMQLVGTVGLTVIAVINVGLLVLIYRLTQFLRRRHVRFVRTSNIVLIVAGILGLWVLDWMFVETPVSLRLLHPLPEEQRVALPPAANADFEKFSLRRGVTDPAEIESLRVMYERIRLNDPEIHATHPIGATLDKYADKYQVDPTLLFFFLYVGSFWGEATSGPVPWLHAMTSETLRDVVQVHLPGWFVENGVRHALIASPAFERVFGKALGFKLRYAVHKATLDVSTQPFDLNLYSDVFVVLREYPDEFPELKQPSSDPVIEALRTSFADLRDNAVLPPYEKAYVRGEYPPAYYDRHREQLERFARSSYYLIEGNFDFATRVAALVIDFQRRHYRSRLGEAQWAQIPAWQQAVMLAMTRDLYIPAVGKLGYNLYALPELNCTPMEFVAAAAIEEHEALGPHQTQLWRPKHYDELWGGAGTKLRIFNEVWTVTHGHPIPGLAPDNTVDDARQVVLRTER